MCGIRDCGSSPRRPTNDWANRKLPRNVAVARRNLPAEVPPSRLPRLPRSASTIGRHLEQSLLTLSCLAVLPCDSSYSDRPAPAKARTYWASRPPLFALKPNFLGAPCSCPHGGGGNSESLAQPLLGLLGFTILMSFVAWADIGELFVPPSTGPGVRLVDMPAPLLALNLALCALPVVAFVLILAGVAGMLRWTPGLLSTLSWRVGKLRFTPLRVAAILVLSWSLFFIAVVV